MRLLSIAAVWVIALPVHAQSFDAGTVDLSLGSLQGGDTITSARAATEMFWENGTIDLQFGASIAQLQGDASEGALRVIASHSVQLPLRFGLSLDLIPDDSIESQVASFGLHALYETPSQYLEMAFMIPDHLDTTGAFSFDIAAEQWLTDDLSITTHLYRRSTDPEVPDFYLIGLGATYALSDKITLVAEAVQTVTDSYDVENNGGRIGVEYQVSPTLAVTTTIMNVVPVRGDAATGISVVAAFAFGDTGERGRLFRANIIPDRFAIANF